MLIERLQTAVEHLAQLAPDQQENLPSKSKIYSMRRYGTPNSPTPARKTSSISWPQMPNVDHIAHCQRLPTWAMLSQRIARKIAGTSGRELAYY